MPWSCAAVSYTHLKLAAEILAKHPKIDVLANNAGGVNSSRRLTEDGFELTWAVNHLAPFLLTTLLLDRIVASGFNPVSYTHLNIGEDQVGTLMGDLCQSLLAVDGHPHAIAGVLEDGALQLADGEGVIDHEDRGGALRDDLLVTPSAGGLVRPVTAVHAAGPLCLLYTSAALRGGAAAGGGSVTQAFEGRGLRRAALSRALRRAAMDRAREEAATQRALRRASMHAAAACGVPEADSQPRCAPCW